MVLFILSLSSSCPNPNIYSSQRAIKSVRNAELSDCSYLLLFPERRVNFAIDCSCTFSYYCYAPKSEKAQALTQKLLLYPPTSKMMPRPPRRYPLWLCSVQVWVYSWIPTRRHDEPIYKRPALGCGEWAAVMDGPRDEWWWMTRLLVTLMMIPSLHKHQLRPYVMKMVKTC